MDVDSKRSSSSSSPSSSVTRSPGGAADNSKSIGTGSCSVVAAGSVWETRMKNDEVRGGIKVFDGGETEGDISSNAEVGGDGERPPSSSNSPVPKAAANKKTGQSINNNGGGKRKTWRSDQTSADAPVSPQVSRSSPGVQAKKGKMEMNPRSPIQGRKLRSETPRGLPELRKLKSDSGKGKANDGAGGGCSSTASGSAQLRKAKSEPLNFVDEASERVGATTEKGGAESGSDGISEDKLVTSISDQNPELPRIQSTKTSDDDEAEEYSEDEEEDDNSDEEIEEKSCEDIKEINMAFEPNQKNVIAATAADKPKPVSGIVDKQPQVNEKPKPVVVPKNVDRQPPSRSPPPETTTKHTATRAASRVNRNIASPTTSKLVSSNTRRKFDVNRNYATPTSYEYESFPEAHSKLQNLVDLVMWRDVSRTAFVFGIGAFTIISSSYTRDLNVSFITVISYLGLVYLATIFLYRSLICRGYVDVQSRGNVHVLREDEAIWLLKLVLPYLNELLFKLKSLFSGDPATTMKLAVLLFVMARCGSSITIWKMAKLGFFGAFTVPKICSSYSTQIYAHGNFWVRRFRDAWESCSHKKAVAFGIFTLVWNLSSVVARIWAAFMLFAAFRYYQQSIMVTTQEHDDDCAKDDVRSDATWQKM